HEEARPLVVEEPLQELGAEEPGDPREEDVAAAHRAQGVARRAASLEAVPQAGSAAGTAGKTARRPATRRARGRRAGYGVVTGPVWSGRGVVTHLPKPRYRSSSAARARRCRC